jgi:sugar transferase (PEP-CTERM/EpsH1 system associated)
VKILFLTHRLPYAPNRGDRVRAFHLLKEMSRWAIVDVVALVHDDEEAGHASDLDQMVRSVSIARVPRISNLARAISSLPTSRPTTHSLLNAPELAHRVDRLAAEKRYDLVLSYCTGIGPTALRPSLARLPLVLDMVDVDSEKWNVLSQRSRWPRSWIYDREARLLRDFERRIAEQARLCLVVNQREKEVLVRIAPSARVTVLENGVDFDALAPRLAPTSDPIVVFCGVMDYAPNVEGVLWFAKSVWPSVRAAHPGARFDVVGARPTRAIRRLHAATGITVTGEVSDVKPFLWNAAVSVAPLLAARGLQNKVLEAVAAGLPAVVTAQVHAGLPEQVRRACRLATDGPAFAAAVIELLHQSAVTRRAIAGAADLESLSWENRLRPLQSLLNASRSEEAED